MLWRCFKMAVQSVINNKMRSVLTMLGIIIGITAVISLVSLMSGLTSEVTDAFEDVGIEAISISITDRASTVELAVDDLDALSQEYPDIIRGYSPRVSMPAYIKKGNDSINSSATGVNEQYIDLCEYKVEYGRGITYIDVERMQKVCVIGTYIANEIFGGDALGKTLQITGTPYRVVGILEERAESEKDSDDDCIYVPYTVAAHATHTSKVNAYTLYATNQETVEMAETLVENLCEEKIGDEDYYTVIALKAIADSLMSILDSMEAMLVAIAAISLVVAGIGIMNIMLVSVTERTREIGIRKSLGAKQRNILTQFVMEAGMLSCIGGVIGIIFGSSLAIGAGKLLEINVYPTLNSIIISFTVSAAIGVFFGYMPARKAARLNPIDALRYD